MKAKTNAAPAAGASTGAERKRYLHDSRAAKLYASRSHAPCATDCPNPAFPFSLGGAAFPQALTGGGVSSPLFAGPRRACRASATFKEGLAGRQGVKRGRRIHFCLITTAVEFSFDTVGWEGGLGGSIRSHFQREYSVASATLQRSTAFVFHQYTMHIIIACKYKGKQVVSPQII